MSKEIDQQLKHNDCGISAVKIIYNLHKIHVNRNYIEDNIYLNESGASLQDLKDFFNKEHFATEFNLLDLNSLKSNPEKLRKYLPCILPVKNNQGEHYVVIKGIRKKKLEVLDPASGQQENWTLMELINSSHTATANYDYVSNSQLLQQIIND